jgi:hypothetical protein
MYHDNTTDRVSSDTDNSSISSIEYAGKNNNISHKHNEKKTEFTDLSYEEVQINLRLLGDLKEGEKLIIADNKYIQVDRRYIQGFRRYISSDSRGKSLRFINHIMYWAKMYCSDSVDAINRKINTQDNMASLINIQKLLGGAQTGLGRLLITYGDDKHNKATIETFISTISTFCDQDLKRAITS